MPDNRERAPHDPLTLQALPVYVTREMIEAAGPKKVKQHHPEHDEIRFELRDAAGRLARRTRTYMIPDRNHMGHEFGSYHALFWGPYIPTEERQKVDLAMANLMEVVPRQAIKLDEMGGFDIVELDDEEHGFIASPQISHIENGHRNPLNALYSRFNLGHAVIDYALSQNVSDLLSPSERQRLLAASDEAIIREIGDKYIYLAVRELAKPALPMYEQAVAEGMVRPEAPGAIEAVTAYIPRHDAGLITIEAKYRDHYDKIVQIVDYEAAEAANTLQTEEKRLRLVA